MVKFLIARRARSKFKVNIFGCISLEKKGFIVAFDGNMNQETYIEILIDHVMKFLESHSNFYEILFLQDNARYHRTEAVEAVFASFGIRVQWHPVYSPDLNPIELLWARLKVEITTEDRSTMDKLINAIFTAFNKLTLEDIANCTNIKKSS